MNLLRRTLLLIALMLWQGGFMFYGGIVVPVGSQALGSHRAMSQITQPVTDYLNAIGAVALLIWAWELGSGPPRRRRLRVALWLGCVLALIGQFVLHQRMDGLMLEMQASTADFGRLHQVYLIISTLQWGLALGLLVLTLMNWRDEDRTPL